MSHIIACQRKWSFVLSNCHKKVKADSTSPMWSMFCSFLALEQAQPLGILQDNKLQKRKE